MNKVEMLGFFTAILFICHFRFAQKPGSDRMSYAIELFCLGFYLQKASDDFLNLPMSCVMKEIFTR